MFLDDIFDMGGGYVLNFSDRTFAQFFAEELNIDINDPLYARNGSSKGERLRCFLQTIDKSTVVRTLKALREYREALRQRSGKADKVENAHGRLLTLINRIEGGPDNASANDQPPAPAFDRPRLAQTKRISSSCHRWPRRRAAMRSRILGGPLRCSRPSRPRSPSASAASRSTAASSLRAASVNIWYVSATKDRQAIFRHPRGDIAFIQLFSVKKRPSDQRALAPDGISSLRRFTGRGGIPSEGPESFHSIISCQFKQLNLIDKLIRLKV